MDATALGLIAKPFVALLVFAVLIIPLRLLILRTVPRRVAYRLNQPLSNRARWLATLGIYVAIAVGVNLLTGSR